MEKKEIRAPTKWRTTSIYVDVETGEIIEKERVLNTKEYEKIKYTINYERKNEYTRKIFINECRRAKQTRIKFND